MTAENTHTWPSTGEGQECSLVDDAGAGGLYGIYKNEDNDDGWIACKQKGTLVGALVPDFYISNRGRSTISKDKYFIDSQSQR